MTHSVVKSEKIGSGWTELTVGSLFEILEKKCPRFQRMCSNGKQAEKVTTIAIPPDNGYMSLVFRLDVHFDQTNDGILSYCLKEPRAERMTELLNIDFFPILIEIHGRECDFYENFSQVSGLKIPRVHAIKRLSLEDKKGYLLMDFAGNRSCRTVPIEQSLSVEQVIAIADQIARLHAHVLLDSNKWDEDKRFEPVNIVASDEGMGNEVFGRLHGRLRKYTDDDLMRRIDEFSGLLDNHDVYNYVVFDAHRELGLPSLTSHGDLWGNNVLFEINENGEITDQIGGLIDWQATNFGNPTQDLVRVMLVSMDAELRRKNQKKILEVYFNKLGEHLKGMKVPFSLNQLEAAAQSFFIYQLALLMFITAHNFENDSMIEQRSVYIERLRAALEDLGPIVSKYLSKWKV
ncbi:hypothetical protein M3Y94_00887400 [Aphelenchoides besseyi]|nr:hypothetical protein M3Y94_00887400 [Aphelenchoides besseyi]